MTEQDFLKVLNATVKKVQSYSKDAKEITSMNEKFSEAGLDSLEMVVVTMQILDEFKIPDEVADSLNATTAKELYDFLLKMNTQMLESA